jgi:esterase/lipase superfamily enzyme
MTRSKRRIRFTVALTILIVVGLGGWFYYIYFVSKDAITQRAENFLFRRMKVLQLSDQGTYRFFYITNRRHDPDDTSLDERFGTEREGILKFGSFDTRIKPALGLGMIIDATGWFQNEEIQLEAVQKLDHTSFVEQLRTLVQDSPHQALLVIIHGFREAFPSALRKTAFLGHILDINAPVLLFDWPGNQGSLLRGYRRAQKVAEASGADLARSLKLIINEIQPERLWLVANSMGAQVVTDAFSLLYRDADFADAETEIENVVLTAPDVDLEEFDTRFKEEITALARNLTVYVSSNDRALLVSRIINRERRRGESSLNIRNPDQFEEASRVSELVEPNSELIIMVDVTPVNRTRNFHNFSLETPEFFDDLYLRLVNTTTPQSRMLYQVNTTDGAVYWVLTRGR